MCGVTGWISYGVAPDLSVVRRMTATLAERGPDGSGHWSSPHAVLGHRRLAVIDIAGSAQPMAVDTPGGPVVLVYSGETYNFIELRDELRALGHRFGTAGDTEVVLHAYLEWGEDVAAHLRGMFAFAVWDARVEQLLLVRDRLGIKPLFYFPLPDGLIFASEPKAILAHPDVQPRVCLEGLRELFTFSRTPGHAVWAGMHEVKPGCVVSFDRSGTQERVYWNLLARRDLGCDVRPEAGQRVRRMLKQIVAEQLVADVPRAVLLSGGLDSSTVTAVAARFLAESGERIRTLSVEYAGQETSFRPTPERIDQDAPYARLLSTHLGTDHRAVVQDPAALADPELRRRVVRAQDLPAGMGEISRSLYLMCAGTRREVTVALSGEGGDEVFGGYRWFHQPQVQQADTFPWIVGGRGRWPNAAPYYTPDFAALLDGEVYLKDSYATAVAAVPDGPGLARERRMRQIAYLHLRYFLPMMLDRKDRISMAAGVEIRVPYCDHELVEYVFDLPWSAKSVDGREKSLLRDAAAGLLPEQVLTRHKSHYPVPDGVGHTQLLVNQVRDLFTEPMHPVFDLFDRHKMQEIVATPAEAAPRIPLERFLDTAAWFDLYRPELRLGP